MPAELCCSLSSDQLLAPPPPSPITQARAWWCWRRARVALGRRGAPQARRGGGCSQSGKSGPHLRTVLTFSVARSLTSPVLRPNGAMPPPSAAHIMSWLDDYYYECASM